MGTRCLLNISPKQYSPIPVKFRFDTNTVYGCVEQSLISIWTVFESSDMDLLILVFPTLQLLKSGNLYENS